MKNWKKLFSKTILDRGYGYFPEGAVENISKEDDVISATVSGTQLYEVEIYLDNGEVSDMECDCPYAEDGNYCKHMAAVLYELENVRSDENPVVKEDSTDMVNAADEAVVKAFLAEILKNDEKLKQRFLLKVSKPKTSVGAYKKLIDARYMTMRTTGASYLNQAAMQASGRKAYQEWVRLLKRMEIIDSGKELARQIAENWRIKYKNRSAMMDELRKL